MGRVIGDGGTVFQIVDVAVLKVTKVKVTAVKLWNIL